MGQVPIIKVACWSCVPTVQGQVWATCTLYTKQRGVSLGDMLKWANIYTSLKRQAPINHWIIDCKLFVFESGSFVTRESKKYTEHTRLRKLTRPWNVYTFQLRILFNGNEYCSYQRDSSLTVRLLRLLRAHNIFTYWYQMSPPKSAKHLIKKDVIDTASCKTNPNPEDPECGVLQMCSCAALLYSETRKNISNETTYTRWYGMWLVLSLSCLGRRIRIRIRMTVTQRKSMLL